MLSYISLTDKCLRFVEGMAETCLERLYCTRGEFLFDLRLDSSPAFSRNSCDICICLLSGLATDVRLKVLDAVIADGCISPPADVDC